jgi:hypothetical protein
MELADTPADTLRFIVVARTLGFSKSPPGLAVTAAIARRPAICGTLLRLYQLYHDSNRDSLKLRGFSDGTPCPLAEYYNSCMTKVLSEAVGL